MPPQNSSSAAAVGFGIVLLIAGLLVAGYFFFIYDTSVSTESRYISGVGYLGGGRVHNQGLMQNRLLGGVAGIAATLIGIVLTVIGSATQPQGRLKPCSYCAELVQANAKICKHCGKNIEETLCPHCQTHLLRMPELAGTVGSCPKCNGTFTYS